jgi:hypothetical protein
MSNYSSKVWVETKRGKIVKVTCTGGFDVGNYHYVLFDENGNFVRKFSNRETNELNSEVKKLRKGLQPYAIGYYLKKDNSPIVEYNSTLDELRSLGYDNFEILDNEEQIKEFLSK